MASKFQFVVKLLTVAVAVLYRVGQLVPLTWPPLSVSVEQSVVAQEQASLP